MTECGNLAVIFMTYRNGICARGFMQVTEFWPCGAILLPLTLATMPMLDPVCIRAYASIASTSQPSLPQTVFS